MVILNPYPVPSKSAPPVFTSIISSASPQSALSSPSGFGNEHSMSVSNASDVDSIISRVNETDKRMDQLNSKVDMVLNILKTMNLQSAPPASPNARNSPELVLSEESV